MTDLPRYTVIIITYNQEHLIQRALDSVLCQNEQLYEIVVSDDCSTDGTWEAVKAYSDKYPHIIKPYRNKKNMGVFKNLAHAWEKVSGDIIFTCAGDDILCSGLFDKANELIVKNNIKYQKEDFVLLFDFKIFYTNGRERVFSNALVEKHNPLSLKIRNLIFNRTIGVSYSVHKKQYAVSEDLGIYTDGLLDIQCHRFAKNHYYMPFVGSVYYSDIGISSKTAEKKHYESRCLLMRRFQKENYFSADDSQWLRFSELKYSYLLQPSLKKLRPYLAMFFKTFTFKYGLHFATRQSWHFVKSLKALLK